MIEEALSIGDGERSEPADPWQTDQLAPLTRTDLSARRLFGWGHAEASFRPPSGARAADTDDAEQALGRPQGLSVYREDQQGGRFGDAMEHPTVPLARAPQSAPRILLTFPPRSLGTHERSIVAYWSGLACDSARGYISERRSDDPVLYRRIVITEVSNGEPTHLIHAPDALALWIKTTIGPEPTVEMFSSLREALNSIRRVLR